MFGNPETTTGGRALKFYSSVRLDIRRIAAIKDGDAVIGNRTRVKVVKNKVASPFREAEFDILYGQGTSREGDLLDLGVTRNLIEKSGSWFSYKGQRIGQGRDSARQFLKENPEVSRQDRLGAALRARVAGYRREWICQGGYCLGVLRNSARRARFRIRSTVKKQRKTGHFRVFSLYIALSASRIIDYDLWDDSVRIPLDSCSMCEFKSEEVEWRINE